MFVKINLVRKVFYMNNEQFRVPDDIFEYNISLEAKLVYMYLCNCEQNKVENGQEISNIAKSCSLVYRDVEKALRELVTVNLIQKNII